MSYLVAGIFAASLAWVVNRLAIKYFGEYSIIWVIPLLEETIKTGVALLSGTSLVLTHGIFGCIEAIHDYYFSRKWGLVAGVSSVVSHLLYGWLTIWIYDNILSWVASVVLVGSLHTFWNFIMIKLFSYVIKKGL
ncbi:MAG: hypothetical protein PHI90_05830 [Clostridia bacterium]|nr:hypothetical protein [Clostridia bacterium]MDD4048331.1 hypothetical protein [Clostridia bacterium]